MSLEREELRRRLVRIAGKENVSSSPRALKSNSTDATGIRTTIPLVVVYPRSAQQIAKIVALANRERIPIVPRGGGSGLCGGAVAGGALVLNMTKMDKILRVGKKSVRVQSGIILDVLETRLSKLGLTVPVRPASHSIATIGGMVSTDAGGENVIRYGRMHESLLSLKAVTGRGGIVSARGEMIRDFCGTEGIMGIVVEVELRTIPIQKERSITIREPGSSKELLRLVRGFTRGRDVLSCEFINPVLYSMISGKKRYFLLAEFAGGRGEVTSARKMRRVWSIREGCNPLLTRKGWNINADPEIPRKRLGDFLAWCEKEKLPAFGHIGHGVIHVHCRDESKMERLYGLVRRLGGSPSGEHGIGLTKKRYLTQSRRELLGRLKRRFDPNGILNYGKVI